MYDPLRILISQNKNEKEAYSLGIEKGKEDGKKEERLFIHSTISHITKRLEEVSDIENKEKNNNSYSYTTFLKKSTKFDAYKAGLKDALIIINKLYFPHISDME